VKIRLTAGTGTLTFSSLLQNHRNTFGFPPKPSISSKCQHLIASLITEKEQRLCSSRYKTKDAAALDAAAAAAAGCGSSNKTGNRCHEFAGRYVFPYDAEDIKAHRWFRGVPWERLHELSPPFTPKLRADDDTHYFEEDEPVSDWGPESSDDEEDGRRDSAVGMDLPPALDFATLGVMSPQRRLDAKQLARELEMRAALAPFSPAARAVALQLAAAPAREADVMEAMTAAGRPADEKQAVRQFARAFGRREPGGGRKRPRDKLLRDEGTKRTVMELRKRSAFLGYSWRRQRPPVLVEGRGKLQDFKRGHGVGPGEAVAVRALHRGRLSLR
jgi:protein-serine/threonine kinase